MLMPAVFYMLMFYRQRVTVTVEGKFHLSFKQEMQLWSKPYSI